MGQEIPACPDSGAEENILSRAMATSLGLDAVVDTNHFENFVLGNGKQVVSIGRLNVECAFAKDPAVVLTCTFHIFSNLIVPLIMGASFLRQTETLTRYRNRLQERAENNNLPLRVMHISGTRERFRCYINSKERLAVADTGSEMDLMSATMARLSPYREMKLHKDAEVEFADGSTASISSQIFSQFSPHPSIKWSPKWFYVLDGLPSSVLLGEETLEKLDAFNHEHSTVVQQRDALGFDLNTIMWLKRPEKKIADAFNLGRSSASHKRGAATGQSFTKSNPCLRCGF